MSKSRINELLLQQYRAQLDTEFEEQMITFNYAEVRKARAFVRKIVEMMTQKRIGAWDNASPYIGCGTINLIFRDVNISTFQMNQLRILVQNNFPECNIEKIYKDLRVYWKGQSRFK